MASSLLRRSLLQSPLYTLCRHQAPRPSTFSFQALRNAKPPTSLSSRTFFSSTKQSIRNYYHQPPPPRGKRFLGFLDAIPHNAIVTGILALNGVVFAMWYMAETGYKQKRDEWTYIWMHKNFINSWQNINNGRYWTILTSCFSHQGFTHLLFNGLTFYFTAPIVAQMLGSRNFIFLYLGSGIASSLSSLFYARYVRKQDRPSTGASGAIYSVVSYLACAAPTTTFYMYAIVPVPAWLIAGGIFGYDAYRTLYDSGGNIDTVGHVGGMLSGAAFCLFLRRRPW